jgi:hypothetical protein
MHDSTLDLFCHHEAERHAMMLEQAAAELEVTVDYYMEEFLLDDHLPHLNS